jgi:hypothetical protein
MVDRTEILRARIALFQSYLALGLPAELAQQFLCEMLADEAELEATEGKGHALGPWPCKG